MNFKYKQKENCKILINNNNINKLNIILIN